MRQPNFIYENNRSKSRRNENTKIEYDIYSKISGNKLEKLNISVIERVKIFIYIAVDIKESIDKYNSSSEYYNDICYTKTSESYVKESSFSFANMNINK